MVTKCVLLVSSRSRLGYLTLGGDLVMPRFTTLVEVQVEECMMQIV